MRKRILILLAVCVIAVLFTGCGTEKSADTKNMKKAVFLYTGEEYFVGDFILSGNVTVFDESGEPVAAEVYYDDLRKVPDKCFEITYWFNYGDMEYPAIQVLWDADKVACFSIDMYSIDKEQNLSFGGDGYFYRYTEDGGDNTSDSVYYFEEKEKEAESKTDIMDRVYSFAAETYGNPVIECNEGEAAAYLMYYDASGTYYYRYDGKPCSLKAENTVITGEGDYVVSLISDSPVDDVDFLALCVEMGEEVFPGYMYFITAITANGKLKSNSDAYTEPGEDNSTTFTYIYNSDTGTMSDDARCPGGEVGECAPIILPASRITDWTELKVYFTVSKPDAKIDYIAKTEEIRSQLNA